jgi:hypothetical protein
MTPMARLPADEDYARALLSIFQAKRVRPRESLPIEEVETAFLNGNMGRTDDFEAAVEFAADQGWVWTGFDRIRLTAPGDEEMQTIWMGRGQTVDTPGKSPPAPPLHRLKYRA